MSVIALTAKKLKALSCPAGKAKENVWDAGCKGLMLELRESGGRTWYLRYTDARGRPRQFRLGDANDISLDQARKRSDELRGQIAMGNDPTEAKRELQQIPTFGEFVKERYMPYVMGYKRSWFIDESLLRNHLLPKLSNRFLDQITKDDIVSIHQGRRNQGGAPATANRLLVLVKYIFSLAVRWEISGVLKNPCTGIPQFEENNNRERYLTQEEAGRLYEAIQSSESKMLKFIVPMLIFTGARKREVLDVRWGDIDFERRVWRIHVNKSGKARHVPLSSGVIQLLSDVKQYHSVMSRGETSSDWIFPNPRTGKPYIQIHYSWDTARKRASLPGFRIHDLRHSFASFLINAGRSLYEVQKILGHTQIKTTQRYSHLAQETLLAAADTAFEALGDSFSPPALRGNAAPDLSQLTLSSN